MELMVTLFSFFFQFFFFWSLRKILNFVINFFSFITWQIFRLGYPKESTGFFRKHDSSVSFSSRISLYLLNRKVILSLYTLYILLYDRCMCMCPAKMCKYRGKDYVNWFLLVTIRCMIFHFWIILARILQLDCICNSSNVEIFTPFMKICNFSKIWLSSTNIY